MDTHMSKIVAITNRATRRVVLTDDGVTHDVSHDDFDEVHLGCGEEYPFEDDDKNNATGLKG